MIDLLINNFLISFIIAFIIDYSGVINYIKRFIFRILNGKKVKYQFFELKPFDCPLCMTFWITLIYNLFSTNVIYAFTFATFFAYLAPFWSLMLDYIYNKYNDFLNK